MNDRVLAMTCRLSLAAPIIACGDAGSSASEPAGATDTDADPGEDGDTSTGGGPGGEESGEGTSGGGDSGEPPPGGDDTQARDGDRLVLEWHEPTSGPRQLLGIRDTDLDVRCSFRVADDGVLRCLPISPATGSHFDETSGSWIPYVHASSECTPRYVVTDDDTSGFSCQEEGFVVHEAGQVRDEVCRSASNGVCSSTGSPGDDAPAGAGYVLAGEQVPASTFVSAVVVLPEGSTRLRHRLLEAEDGARVGWDLYDTDEELPCSFRRASDGQMRCLPDVPRDGFAFIAELDDWHPYLRGNTDCAPTLLDWPESASGFTCDETTYEIWRPGAPIDELCVQTTNGACSTVQSIGDEAPIGAGYYVAEDALELDRFVAAGEEEDGEGRIRSLILVTEDGFRLEVGLRDSELGIDCGFMSAADGTQRCLPTTFADGRHFNVRSQQWEPFRQGNGACEPAFITRSADQSNFDCTPPTFDVHAVVGTETSICRSEVGGGCGSWESTSDASPSGAAYHLGGDTVDPRMFAG